MSVTLDGMDVQQLRELLQRTEATIKAKERQYMVLPRLADGDEYRYNKTTKAVEYKNILLGVWVRSAYQNRIDHVLRQTNGRWSDVKKIAEILQALSNASMESNK